MEVGIHQKYMKKLYKKTSRKMMQKLSAKKLQARSGPWARSAGRGKEFLRRLQVKVPSCIQHPAKKQRPGKQLKSNLETQTPLARTWRAGRHGADLLIYWAPWPPGLGEHWPPPRGPRLSVYVFWTKK